MATCDHYALKQTGIESANALFIDDIEENITEWKVLGGHGIIYDARKHSTEELADQLRIYSLID